MEPITATALVVCRTWPCQLLVIIAVGALAGAAAGYLAASSAIKRYMPKTSA